MSGLARSIAIGAPVAACAIAACALDTAGLDGASAFTVASASSSASSSASTTTVGSAGGEGGAGAAGVGGAGEGGAGGGAGGAGGEGGEGGQGGAGQGGAGGGDVVCGQGEVLGPGDHCYLFVAVAFDWWTARAACQAIGAELVAPSTIAELEFVNVQRDLAFAFDDPLWLGGHDMTAEGQFEWSNGEPFTYLTEPPGAGPWGPSEPNDTNGGENCVELTGCCDDLNDLACWSPKYYACERAP